MNSILLMFNYSPKVGYAFDSLISTFIEMAEQLVRGRENIHISFTRLDGLQNNKYLSGLEHLIEFEPASKDRARLEELGDYVRRNKIDVVFGFDFPVWLPSYKYLRRAGVSRIVSCLGAPMSKLNKGIQLRLKQVDVWLRSGSPDHYIFESNAMAETGFHGRGIPRKNTSVVYLGVDVDKFKPAGSKTYYAHDAFNIPNDRRIIYYSGHMEERKGVAVLVQAARYLFDYHKREDFHFLILGNKGGEEQRFLEIIRGSGASRHVTFGGYRQDVEEILPACFAGVIASTGWDSFTMSSLEIAACGLPLMVSRLQGLVETIEENETGLMFAPGDYRELAGKIQALLDDPEQRDRLGRNARQRVLSGFTRQNQLENLVNVMREVVAPK